jgi:DNA polymerase-3 subunit delta
LKEYLKNPSPTTTLVFQAEGLDKRRNISTVLLKSCTLVEFNRLKEREAIEWASNYLRTYGYQLSGNAASLLIGLTGTDLFTISNELDKLMTARATPGLISPTDIEALVIRSREHSNFELADAIVAGEKKRALRLLSRQLADKQEPVLILGMLARVLRQLLLAKQLMEQQFPASEIAREIGIPPFRIAEFLTQAKKWHSQQLLYFIKQVAAADNAIKSSLGKPQLQLEYLVCELLIKN